jgi:DnaJ-class molecular chaperone
MKPRMCLSCNGRGEHSQGCPDAPEAEMEPIPCPECDAAGVIDGEPCTNCEGAGHFDDYGHPIKVCA